MTQEADDLRSDGECPTWRSSKVFIFSLSRRGQVLVKNLAVSHSDEPGSGRGGACREPSSPSHSPIARDRGDSAGEAEATWRRFWGASSRVEREKHRENLCENPCDNLTEILRMQRRLRSSRTRAHNFTYSHLHIRETSLTDLGSTVKTIEMPLHLQW